MNTQLFVLAFGLLTGLSLSHAYAQTNTVYGLGAGTGGTLNTHIGYYAGTANKGIRNTFIGAISGNFNTTGSYNTFVGYYSGISNTIGSDNTFVGYYSGWSNKNGYANIFLGGYSGGNNTSGSYNTFLGYSSGKHNTIGHNNTFLGNYSGYRNISGYQNIFLGNYSGHNNTLGKNNAFVGHNSGYYNTTGYDNTFVGYLSGVNNTIGNSNTCLGSFSGYSNQSGRKNVFIGYKAGYSETGSNRLYIDNNNDNKPLLYGNFSSNVLSIGKKYKGTAYKLDIPGKVRATAYDVVSDERLKKDVHALQDALTKVQKVEGVSYALKEEAIVGQDESNDSNTRTSKATEPILYGFLAQNIQEVFPELVTEDEGMLAVNYQGMIPVLVEAIKALSVQTEQKDSVILALQQEVSVMKQALQQRGIMSAADDKVSPALGTQLEQNFPNPFDQSTTIGYRVATEARQVSLIITNLQGVAVQRYDNLSTGQGQVEIASGSLGAGTYVYTLVVDGKPVAAHKMMLSR